MDEVRTNAATLKLLGGRLSLDFANTADWHASDHPVEFLTSYSDLVAWSQHVGILTDHQTQRLLKEATRRPEDATAVLERAIALREAIYRMFTAISHGRPPQAADLATFNAEYPRRWPSHGSPRQRRALPGIWPVPRTRWIRCFGRWCTMRPVC